MSFAVALVDKENTELVSSYGTKDDALFHAAGFVLVLVKNDFDLISNQKKTSFVEEVIKELEKQNYKKVIELWNSEIKPYDNDPELVILESKLNFNMSKSHQTLADLLDRLGIKEKEIE